MLLRHCFKCTTRGTQFLLNCVECIQKRAFLFLYNIHIYCTGTGPWPVTIIYSISLTNANSPLTIIVFRILRKRLALWKFIGDDGFDFERWDSTWELTIVKNNVVIVRKLFLSRLWKVFFACTATKRCVRRIKRPAKIICIIWYYH